MSYKSLTIICAGLACLTISFASPAMARNAKCLIKSGNTTQFRGVCDFRAQANGSFSLTRSRKSRRFLSEVILVSVTVMSKNRADVRGLTKAGINSRWGAVKRSRKNRACWLGDDFKICAW